MRRLKSSMRVLAISGFLVDSLLRNNSSIHGHNGMPDLLSRLILGCLRHPNEYHRQHFIECQQFYSASYSHANKRLFQLLQGLEWEKLDALLEESSM